MTVASYPVLGEAFKIGDIIQQERPNFESRKIITLAASQGAIQKGQVLGQYGSTQALAFAANAYCLILNSTTGLYLNGSSNVPTIYCIALQNLSNSTSPQQILVLYREAMVKPGYLSYVPSSGAETANATQIAIANAGLELGYGVIVLSGPTYNSAQDVVGPANNATEESDLTVEGSASGMAPQVPGL